MASSWGDSWGESWGDSWGPVDGFTPPSFGTVSLSLLHDGPYPGALYFRPVYPQSATFGGGADLWQDRAQANRKQLASIYPHEERDRHGGLIARRGSVQQNKAVIKPNADSSIAGRIEARSKYSAKLSANAPDDRYGMHIRAKRGLPSREFLMEFIRQRGNT